MYYLDTNTPMINYQMNVNSKIYVDKSLLIEKMNELLNTTSRYVCITRPRRFGKTINVSMLGAYYTVGYDAQNLFKGLKIENSDSFKKHLNKHHVIYIDFSRMPDRCDCFDDYLDWVKFCLKTDMKEAFNAEGQVNEPIQEIVKKTEKKFIFLLDEWDSIFYEDFMSESDKKSYLKF